MKFLTKTAIILIVVVAFHLLINLNGVISFFDFRIFDIMANHKRSATISPESCSTVIVEIDEQSLDNLGQWPWPRIILAKILQEILIQKPAAVGFDIFFPEKDRTSPVQLKNFYKDILGVDIQINGFPPGLEDHDLVFADALANGPTVLPLFASSSSGVDSSCSLSAKHLIPIPKGLKLANSNHILCNTSLLQQSAQGFGFINASVDIDGIIRRQSLLIRYKQQGLLCFALAMISQIDPDIRISLPRNSWSPLTISFADKKILANHHGEILNILYDMSSFKRISAARVLTQSLPSNLFTGKMVLIGASAAGLFDQYMTAKGKILPGVFAHASLLENFIRERNIYQPEITKKLALVMSCLFSMIMIALVIKRHYLLSWGLYAGVSFSSLVLTWIMLNRGLYISLGYFLTSFSVLFFIISLFFAILHYVERKRFLEDLGAAHSATIDSMTMVAESRDVETGAHIVRTKEYVVTLARTLRGTSHYNEKLTHKIIDLLYRAAPLHDIGKVGIPDAILCKPGKHNEDETKVMQSHVDIGQSIIENAINNYNKTNDFLIMAANLAYSHHEKWDGSGYPLGLAGELIPLEGRLMALADVYDALISHRCYKNAISFLEAEQMIIKESGKHFDPTIVQAFKKCRKKFRMIALNIQENTNSEPLPYISEVKNQP